MTGKTGFGTDLRSNEFKGTELGKPSKFGELSAEIHKEVFVGGKKVDEEHAFIK